MTSFAYVAGTWSQFFKGSGVAGHSGALTRSASVPPSSKNNSSNSVCCSNGSEPIKVPKGTGNTCDSGLPISNPLFLVTAIGSGKGMRTRLGIFAGGTGQKSKSEEGKFRDAGGRISTRPGEKNVSEKGGNTEKYKLRGEERERRLSEEN